MSKTTQIHNQFFLSFFNKDKYAELEVNGWWLIKHWDGKLEDWRVDLYPAKSYKAYKRSNQLFAENKENESHLLVINDIINK